MSYLTLSSKVGDMVFQKYYNGHQYFLSFFSTILGMSGCTWTSPLYGYKIDASGPRTAFRSDKVQLKNNGDFSVCVSFTREETFLGTIIPLSRQLHSMFIARIGSYIHSSINLLEEELNFY